MRNHGTLSTLLNCSSIPHDWSVNVDLFDSESVNVATLAGREGKYGDTDGPVDDALFRFATAKVPFDNSLTLRNLSLICHRHLV
jgi:hypothetical protein